ncbi:MAG TPA: hypothetical protein VGK54_13750, partial [Chloroflexota bacterium]
MAVTEAIKTYQNYIGGEWVGAGNPIVEIFDPGNSELVYRAASASVEDARNAVAAARHAADTSDWADDPNRRQIALSKLA